MAQGPDLGPGACGADKGVVAWDRSVAIDSHDLAERAAHILRRRALMPLACGDIELFVGTECQSTAEMAIVMGNFWRLSPDDADPGQGAGVAGKRSPSDGEASAARSRLGKAEIDQLDTSKNRWIMA